MHWLSSSDSSSLPCISINQEADEGEEAIASISTQADNPMRLKTYKAKKMKDSLVNFKLQDPPKGAFSSHWL